MLKLSGFLAGLILVSASSFSQADTDRESAELAFWDCDYAATQGIIPKQEASVCSVVYFDLVKRYFDGDSKAFMAWWLENKQAKHELASKRSKTE